MSSNFGQSSIRRRIFFACCVLVGLCIVSNAIGLLGQSKLLQNFTEYEQAEQTLGQFAKLDRDIEELKSRTRDYLNSGAESHIEDAIETQERLLANIDQLRSEVTGDNVSETLDRMRQSLSVFRKQLDNAASERELRRHLVMSELPAKQAELQNAFARFRDLAQFEDGKQIELLFDLQQEYDSAVHQLDRYFIELNSVAFDQALQSIKRCRQLAKEIDTHNETSETVELKKELDTQLVAFKKLASRSFQATRGYMYYINVVMAGEISEFVYYSNQLKGYVESTRHRNRNARQAGAKQSRYLGLIASLIAVGLAIFLASRLAYSIVSPISKITETFRLLGEGINVTEIPALERSDEIGRMATAAKIFNDKNRETESLYHRSQELADELSKKAEALKKTNEELDNFAYVASHDLKSPLRGISHLATWIKEDCDEMLPDESKSHLNQMQGRVKKMQSLLDDLLDYSRVGKVNPQPEKVDSEELISSTALMVDTIEGIEIEHEGPSISFKAVRTPLQQTLLNLITNGVKYNDKGSEGWVRVTAKREGKHVLFSVRDNGRGIPKAYHEKVFQMYQRVAIDVAEGSGMGLAIVKKQVESNGGKIQLISDGTSGTEFRFTWLLSDGDSPKDSTTEPLQESS